MGIERARHIPKDLETIEVQITGCFNHERKIFFRDPENPNRHLSGLVAVREWAKNERLYWGAAANHWVAKLTVDRKQSYYRIYGIEKVR